LTSPVELSRGDAVTLALADLELKGTVVDGGAADGRAAYRIAGGAGGWGREVGVRSYSNDAGVLAATVVGDVAAEVGETVEGAGSNTISRHYVRAEEPASAVLHRLYPRGWYVDFEGVTQVGQRSESEYTGEATRTRRAPGVGAVDVVSDTLASLVPGVVVDGGLPATDVEYVLDDGRLTARVYSGTRPARRLAAWARLTEALDPARRYRGTYEYRVVSQSGDRVNLQIVRAATGMPDLRRAPVCGPWGVRAVATPGAVVKVSFADSDPSRPFVSAGPAWDDPGWLTTGTLLGPEPRLGVARLTDAVVAGGFAGTITFASTTVQAGL
jgi:hypothetical protein